MLQRSTALSEKGRKNFNKWSPKYNSKEETYRVFLKFLNKPKGWSKNIKRLNKNLLRNRNSSMK